MKQFSAAAERNRSPILAVLRRVLPPSGTVLEIASGTGQHAVAFAAALPGVLWQPSDADPAGRASVAAWTAEAGLPNVLPPLALDVTAADWPLDRADAVFCANLIHISPWATCRGLMAGAARLLPPGGPLLIYGPFFIDGLPTAPSNVAFDRSLRARDAAWGVRALHEVEAVAVAAGLRPDERVEMPANNFTLIFRMVEQP